jgi:hypothetical protein
MENQLENKNVISDEFILYENRQFDGMKSLNLLMAELRLNSVQNNYPREVNKSIETAFEGVINSIQLGWWVTAKEKCELVPVAGYVTQQLWDRIYLTITQYIAANY